MRELVYSTIVLSLALGTAYGPFLVLVMMGFRGRRLYSWVVTYAFYRMLKKKTDQSGETRWLLKDIDLTHEEKILTRVISSLFFLFLILFGGVIGMFYHLLLLEVRFRCDPNEVEQDCFKHNMLDLAKWETIKQFSRERVDCNSTAVKEETVDVICYKLVFNIGLASGAGYGGFQICMVLLNLAASALLMCKKTTIFKIKVSMFFMSLVFLVVYVGVQITSLRHYLISDNLVVGFQMLVAVVVGYCFLFCVPWRRLIALKQARIRQQDTDLENNAASSQATGVENKAASVTSLTDTPQKDEKDIEAGTTLHNFLTRKIINNLNRGIAWTCDEKYILS